MVHSLSSDEVTLLPFELLPESPQKRALSEIADSTLYVPFYTFQPPQSALIVSVDIERFIKRPNDPVPTQPELYARFEDVRHCLAIARRGVVMPGPSWFQYEDPDLQAAVLGGGGTSLGHQEVVPLFIADDALINIDEAVETVRLFYALSDDVRRRVRTAMERIHLSFIRSSPADKALELAIALETMLVDSAGENTFKIALRAALLAGGDVETRTRNRAIIGAAYGLRSALMHSGQSPAEAKVRGQGKLPANVVAERAIDIGVAVIRRILMDRGEPDWNVIELAPPS